MVSVHPKDRETHSSEYAHEMVDRAGKRWKKVLNVQAPYRWNVRRHTRGKVLDVGCGIGRNLSYLDDAVGIDHNPLSIDVARAAGLRAWTTDEWPDSVDARPGSFDTLLVAHVLEHLQHNDGIALLETYFEFLKPSARLVLICPQEAGFRIDPVTHVRFVTGDDLATHAKSIGFEPVSNASFPFPRPVGKVFTYNEFVLVADRVL